MRAVPFFSSRSAALVFRISRLYHLLLVHSPDSLNLKKKKDYLQSNLSGVQVQNKIQCTFHTWSYCQVSPLKVPDIPVGSSMGIPTKLSLLIIIFYNFAKKSWDWTGPLSPTSFYGHAPHTISDFYFHYLFLYHLLYSSWFDLSSKLSFCFLVKPQQTLGILL